MRTRTGGSASSAASPCSAGGEPRLTRDVYLTLLTGYGEEDPYVTRLLSHFESRVEDALGFARRARVALLRTTSGMPVDVALGALPFELRTVGRSSTWAVPGTAPLRTCSAEDLVVHKVFAARDRDWADVRTVLERQGDLLDLDTVTRELRPLLELKGDLDALDRLTGMLT